MLNINTYIATGRLTRDAESKAMGNTTLTKFGIAVANPHKDKDGTWHQGTAFMDVEVWGKPAEWCAEYQKGEAVLIEGSIRMDKWEKDGKQQTKLKVVANNVKQYKEPESAASGRSGRVNAETYVQEDGGPSDGLVFDSGAGAVGDDSDIPF